MIIQCEQCQTKFKLDDAKVTAKGVKVRCAKCKNVFTVRSEEGQDFGALLDNSTAFGQERMAASVMAADFGVSEPAAESFDMSEISLEEEKETPPPAADDFSLSSLEDDQAFAVGGQAGANEMDFSGMDFGEVSVDADKTMLAGAAVPDFGEVTMIQAPAQATAKDYDEIDLGEESLFGDAVAVPVHEEPTEPIKFDFSDDFSDSFDTTGNIGKSLAKEAKAEEPFSLGEIDFGDELSSVAVQQIHPDELKPAQDFLFTPLGETHDKLSAIQEEKPQPARQPEPQVVADEMPPLSISSRRKQSPLLAGLIALLAVVVVAVVGYLGYNLFADGKAKTAAEAGRISVRSVKASFVKNPSAGEMLVLTGEAVNEYNKPRAALQVKGSVFGANGQVLTSKNAYCGNPLTNEQISTMPVEKIEAAMANQFGDSLANMEIAPGQAIPFVVVIPNLPADAKDYTVEPAGSTVATAKQ